MKVYLIYSVEQYEDAVLLYIKDSKEKAEETIKELEEHKKEEEEIQDENFALSEKRQAFVNQNNCLKKKLSHDEEIELDDLFLKRCLSEREKYVDGFGYLHLGHIYYTEWEVT